MYRASTLYALLVLLLLSACSAKSPPTNTTELAERLYAGGLLYTEVVALPKPQGKHLRFDEAVALKSDTHWVELVRVDNKKVFGIAAQAAGLLSITEAKIGRELPGKPAIYTRYPFIIVVRQEPVAGGVLQNLGRILLESS